MMGHSTAGGSSSGVLSCVPLVASEHSSSGEQFIAERGIEYGLLSGLGFAACQSKNPQNPQSPKLPLYKEILRILPKLRKIEGITKKLVSFFAEME